MLRAWPSVVLVALAGCGGQTEPSTGSGGATASGSGSGSSSGGASAACPTNAPTRGAACTTAGLQCEYGSSPRPSCDIVARCTSGVWAIAQPTGDGGSACVAGPCPATSPSPASACAPQGLSCFYSPYWCNCAVRPSPTGNSSVVDWSCTPLGPGCPASRPRLGTACTQPELTCDYGVCSGSTEEVCTRGIWQEVPPSTVAGICSTMF